MIGRCVGPFSINPYRQTRSLLMSHREQILFGIREIWSEVVGDATPFEDDESFIEWLKRRRIWDDLDLDDLRHALNHHLGSRIVVEDFVAFLDCGVRPDEDWNDVAAPRLTFACLAEFVAEHVERISFDSVRIAGKDCAPAGAFFGLVKVAASLDNPADDFGPSTVIEERMRYRQLLQFFYRLRWRTLGRSPSLRFPLSLIGCSVLLLSFLSLATAIPLWNRSSVQSLIALCGGVSGIATGWLLTRIYRLPEGVRTFGDLARAIAGSPARSDHRRAA